MNDRALERAALVQDFCVVVLALWLAHVAREGVASLMPALKPAVPRVEYVPLLVAFVPVWLWCAERFELNRVRTLVGPWVETVRALVWTQAWAAVALALLLVAAQAPLNRSYLALYGVLSTFLLLLTKWVQRSWITRARGEVVALFVGEAEAGVVEELVGIRGRRLERLAEADGRALRDRLQRGGVDEVVLAGTLPADRRQALVEVCTEAGVLVLVRAEHLAVGGVRPAGEVVGRSLYLAYDLVEPDRPSMLVKAIVDRAAAALALLAFAPVLALIALLVKVTSPGPAFFLQRRGGLNGRPFPMLKYRTMRQGAEKERELLLAGNEMDGPVFKMRDDPRVTPLGRWLRRASLDELPQLVNVLLGHMSLVGPRPLPIMETEALVGTQRRRLAVRPGITGLWQVSGRNAIPFDRWMALDLEYVDRWSLGLDLAILLRTIPALLTGRGAH